jgi:hypothetical protein
MSNPHLQKLLRKEMSRKEFLAFSAFLVASVFGIVGLLRQFTSKGATPTASLEPETGTRTAGATVTTDASASGGQAVKFATPGSVTVPGGAVTHGFDLSLATVGPWAVQGVAKGSETLSTLTSTQLQERLSTWPSDGRPSWIPGTPYAYNNNPTNYGGIVPAGGMMIDGYNVAAGTWVVQFRNFTGGLIISGDNTGTSAAWPGVVFRGCRMRGGWGAPGWYNHNGQSHGGVIWIMYCDAGGKSLATGDYCESIFESKNYVAGRDKSYVVRNYLSNATTLVFMRNNGDACIENYCQAVSDFGDSSKHLNGLANSGGQTCTLWLRNHMIMAQQAGSTQLTNVLQMAADDGAYLGAGTNLDGSVGYAITNNYLGGAAFTLQLGYDKSNTITQVRNVRVTGNKFSTSLYPNSGSSGIAYKTPDFSNYGNTWTGNTWADGANAGQTVPAPPIIP